MSGIDGYGQTQIVFLNYLYAVAFIHSGVISYKEVDFFLQKNKNNA